MIVGPKDFPIMLKKIGGWIGSIKKYFNEIQKDMIVIENEVEEDISILKNKKDKKKDE